MVEEGAAAPSVLQLPLLPEQGAQDESALVAEMNEWHEAINDLRDRHGSSPTQRLAALVIIDHDLVSPILCTPCYALEPLLRDCILTTHGLSASCALCHRVHACAWSLRRHVCM